jgi:CMP-N-acetylneuraminic acid synthetase
MYADRERSYGYLMDRFHSVEIDEMIDLYWAEFLVEKGYIDLSYWK